MSASPVVAMSRPARLLASIREAVGGTRATHCDACFSGEYPLAGTEEANGKHALEAELPLVGSGR